MHPGIETDTGADAGDESGTRAELRQIVEAFVASPANALPGLNGDRAWDPPLVGFAAGDDPLFAEFRRHIGEFFWTPEIAFAHGFPGLGAGGEELTVVSWVLPQTAAARRENRAERRAPSRRWAHVKADGEEFNNRLRAHVVRTLAAAGVAAVAPLLLPQWREARSDGCGQASTWSERHAAFAAGLGTFGLCDGLITPLGKAMRCGSVVARLRVSPSARPYAERHAYCLFYSDKRGCGACMRRCPIGAISEAGHDKDACLAYLDKLRTSLLEPVFGVSTNACGLCQTGVPCEARIPARLRPRDDRALNRNAREPDPRAR